MAYQQVKAIVHELAEKHLKASEACSDDKELFENSRVALLLEHFEAFEADVYSQVQINDESERQEILETWIQYVPMEPVDEALQALKTCQTDKKLDHLIEFHQAATNLIETLSEQVSSEKVKNFFENLSDAENTFSRQCSTAQIRRDEI